MHPQHPLWCIRACDPLDPLLFCITVMSLVNRMKSQCYIWYMDDGALGDDVDTLLSDFKMLVTESRKLGLNINVSKCEIITDDVAVVQMFIETSRRIFVTSSCRQQCCWVHLLVEKSA